MKILDLTGKKFGMLTVVEKVGQRTLKGHKKDYIWLCKCDCGQYKEALTWLLNTGDTWHCGCKAYENRNRRFGPKEASFRAKASTYKSQAKMRKMEWSITIEEASLLLMGNCYYCGGQPDKPFNSLKNRKNCEKNNSGMSQEHFESGLILYNGIDRLNSNLGYTKENSVSCCTFCNFAKNDKTLEEFLAYLNRVVQFRSNICV